MTQQRVTPFEHAHDLFHQGQLKEAIAATEEGLRKSPSHFDLRGFLSVLLCFDGNLERADLQLQSLAQLDGKAEVGVSLTRQLIRAETWRQEFHRNGRVPEMLGEPDERTREQLRAGLLLREGQLQEARQAFLRSEELRKPLAGTCDGQAMDDFRDLDDPCGGFFEVLTTTGKYFLIPADTVETVSLRPLQRPRDLLWRRAGMTVRGGPDGEVYLPTVYAPVGENTPVALRLGRETDWTEDDSSPVRGMGLRTFLVGDEAKTILGIEELAFARGAEA